MYDIIKKIINTLPKPIRNKYIITLILFILWILFIDDYNLNKNGWWFSIKSADVNNDGLMDLIAGNIGLNIKFKPSVNFPVKMYINDFDNNESFEQIVTYIRNGKEYPLADRDEITKQLSIPE